MIQTRRVFKKAIIIGIPAAFALSLGALAYVSHLIGDS